MFESLEGRTLLSVTLDNGVLTVTGTAEADQLFVGRNQTMIVVSDNGTQSQWNPAEVTSVSISGLGGDDHIGVGRVHKPVLADGGEGNDALRGGPGRERLLGGDGNDHIFGGGGGDLLEGGEGNDVIVGGPGPDRMFGNAGNDRFDAVDRDHDLLDGGEGEDFARINRGDRAHNIEHVFGGGPHPGDSLEGTSPDLATVVDEVIVIGL